MSVVFAADGKLLASGGLDSTALVWKVPALPWDKGLRDKALEAGDLDRLWATLASNDAAKAYRAVWRLVAAPEKTVPFLAKHLPPRKQVDPGQIEQLIVKLDAAKFAVRQAAVRELEKLAEQAEGTLQRALEKKPSLEVRKRLESLLARIRVTPEAVRRRLAIQVLEPIGSPAARQVLQTLTKGTPGARETREAGAALQRLAGRKV
jgi:hypothetical protein